MDAGVAQAGPLDQQHREHGGRMVTCNGIQMPMWYSGRGAIFEARAARESVGIFDCSHLPRIFVTGGGAQTRLRQTLTYDVDAIAVESSHEALFCSESGHVVDRVRLHHLGDVRWLLVSDANGNGSGSIQTYLHSIPDGDIRVDDRTGSTVMLALQGPLAVELLGELLTPTIAARTPIWHSTEIELYGHKALLWRTGEPQGNGFQIVCSIDAGRHLWHLLIAAGATPCGLSSREILRQEGGRAEVGHELDVESDPYEAGLGSLISSSMHDFRGKAALEKLHAAPERKLVVIAAREIGGMFRPGFSVHRGAMQVAHLSSGGFSPLLGRSIGLAFVPTELAHLGTELLVDVRGRRLPAVVSPAPAPSISE